MNVPDINLVLNVFLIIIIGIVGYIFRREQKRIDELTKSDMILKDTIGESTLKSKASAVEESRKLREELTEDMRIIRKETVEIKNNYLERFETQKDLLMKHHEELITKFGEIKNIVTEQKILIELIQKNKEKEK